MFFPPRVKNLLSVAFQFTIEEKCKIQFSIYNLTRTFAYAFKQIVALVTALSALVMILQG